MAREKYSRSLGKKFLPWVAAGILGYATPSYPDQHRHAGERDVDIGVWGEASERDSCIFVGVRFAYDNLADLTAVLNPSRYSNPRDRGKVLCWTRKDNWQNYPVETGEVLAGEAALVAGTAYALDKILDNDENKKEGKQGKTKTVTKTNQEKTEGDGNEEQPEGPTGGDGDNGSVGE